MRSFKELTKNYTCISDSMFVFKSQIDVCFEFSFVSLSYHLIKADLIGCINYYIAALSRLGYAERLKSGFNLSGFEYYELSVYLHGILQVYRKHFGDTPLNDLNIVKFSHLPHDVLEPEKPLLNIEYAVLHDIKGLDYCVCVTNIPRIFRTYDAMKIGVDVELSHKYRLNFVLVNELPF